MAHPVKAKRSADTSEYKGYKTGGFVKGAGFVPFAKKDGTEEVSKAANKPPPKGLPDDKAPRKPMFGKSCGGSASGAKRREMAQKTKTPY